MKKTQQIKLIGIVSIILITLLGIFTVAIPFVNQASKLATTQDEIIKANAQLDNNIKKLNTDKNDVNKVTSLYQELKKKFPDTVQPTALIADVSNAATKAGMGANNVEGVQMSKPEPITPTATGSTQQTTENTKTPPTTDATQPAQSNAPTGGNSNLAQMKVTITVNGTGTQLGAFLGALNEVNRVIKVNSVEISANKDGVSTMTVNGTTYLYKGIAVPSAQAPQTPATPSTGNETTGNKTAPTPTAPTN